MRKAIMLSLFVINCLVGFSQVELKSIDGHYLGHEGTSWLEKYRAFAISYHYLFSEKNIVTVKGDYTLPRKEIVSGAGVQASYNRIVFDWMYAGLGTSYERQDLADDYILTRANGSYFEQVDFEQHRTARSIFLELGYLVDLGGGAFLDLKTQFGRTRERHSQLKEFSETSMLELNQRFSKFTKFAVGNDIIDQRALYNVEITVFFRLF